MSDEHNAEPIGEPQPIEPKKGDAILKQFAAMIGIFVGGVLAFAAFLAPTRVQGASRSARLKWQERQKEIQETVARTPTTETTPAPRAGSAGQPANSGSQ